MARLRRKRKCTLVSDPLQSAQQRGPFRRGDKPWRGRQVPVEYLAYHVCSQERRSIRELKAEQDYGIFQAQGAQQTFPWRLSPPEISRPNATIKSVSRRTPQQQQAWLRELKSRLDWANRLALSPEDSARQEARVAAMLHQKTVSMQALLELVRELNTRERDAVARMVAQYRGESYQAFGGQGPEFTRHQEAWYRVWDLWTKPAAPATSKTA